jgi:hypothetical protein
VADRRAAGAIAAVTGVTAGSGATVSVLGWAWPGLLDIVGWSMVVTTFFVAFAGLLATMALDGADASDPPAGRPKGRRAPSLKGLPSRLKLALVGISLAAVASAIAGFVVTSGYSVGPHQPGTGCEWPITTDHGSIRLCVSHGRWLRTIHGFEHGFLGLTTIFGSLECAINAARWARAPADAARQLSP